ncbi:unnamed protein product [Cylindrotheca closterium]|uniref:Phosphodiesterase n=1 Tax=Cylindrotheca closterium TaxID=2856 RepID=A0AAD2CPW6_9STRA|nr:unnamed protein product [Cylindrotheca closterium]
MNNSWSSNKPAYSTQSSALLEDGESNTDNPDADHHHEHDEHHDHRRISLISERSSMKSKSLTESETMSSAHRSRDEVQEVRNASRNEDRSVKLWRLALFLFILATGISVSYLTYHFLLDEEKEEFNIAYDQFSDALEAAAIRQQKDIREAYRTFETIISNYAAGANETWPFVSLPLFESFGKHIIEISGTEVFSLFPVVTRENQEAWLKFTDQHYESMVKEAHMLETGTLDNLKEVGYHSYFTAPSPNGMVPDIERDVYYPGWHYSPPPFTYGNVNWNVQSVPDYNDIIEALYALPDETLLTGVRPYAGGGTALSDEEHAHMHSEINDSSSDYPHSFVFHPVHLNAEDPDSPIVAFIGSAMAWDFSLLHMLPEGVVGILAVIENNCGQTFTYRINGPNALYLGMKDMHKEEYEPYERVVDLALHTNPAFELTPGHCQFTMHLYPDTEFAELYLSSAPKDYGLSIAGCFGFMILVFSVYNGFVHKRNEKLIASAARSNAVVTSLFPENIRNKIVGDNNPRNFHDLVGSGSDLVKDLTRPPLADYFPVATVMYADICGFTAWSSVREPSQVFKLLEAVYGSFDRQCRHSKVFKVETQGDCYIAATGIPDYYRDHAVRMVLFAHKISRKMSKLTKQLETTLGPDTADLKLKIGIHTGAVTAGVIRGDKARFQLFGDSVNVASRMESTGIGGRIQVSQETAESLRSCGKGHWLIRRDEGTVIVKGKGDIQTYWIGKVIEPKRISTAPTAKSDSASETSASERNLEGPFAEQLNSADGREDRLVEWNATVFLAILQHIVARRDAYASASHEMEFASAHDLSLATAMKSDFKPLDEVREIIALPKFDPEVAQSEQDPHTIEIPSVVVTELRQFISTISGFYRSNPFHNFEHASHVTMSVIKLLSRIKAPTDLEMMEGNDEDEEKYHDIHAQSLHDHTYGITSDPLTQFACAFAALVHDVDHEGVPNAQLVKEKAAIATLYDSRSVAEQNSLVIAWNLFMGERFENLRDCVCSTPAELSHFRMLVVNAVMATDIVDKDLKQLRNNRWDTAFKRSSVGFKDNGNRDNINRKATIVIEHLIQASDISHTMQHWHVYRKWNELFFRECYKAWKEGRADKDPSVDWYKGEIGFFDFYIIPLAKKLESCGVFGKSSDEFLNYARSNRAEWESRGEDVVREILESIKQEERHDKLLDQIYSD